MFYSFLIVGVGEKAWIFKEPFGANSWYQRTSKSHQMLPIYSPKDVDWIIDWRQHISFDDACDWTSMSNRILLLFVALLILQISRHVYQSGGEVLITTRYNPHPKTQFPRITICSNAHLNFSNSVSCKYASKQDCDYAINRTCATFYTDTFFATSSEEVRIRIFVKSWFDGVSGSADLSRVASLFFHKKDENPFSKPYYKNLNYMNVCFLQKHVVVDENDQPIREMFVSQWGSRSLEKKLEALEQLDKDPFNSVIFVIRFARTREIVEKKVKMLPWRLEFWTEIVSNFGKIEWILIAAICLQLLWMLWKQTKPTAAYEHAVVESANENYKSDSEPEDVPKSVKLHVKLPSGEVLEKSFSQHKTLKV